MGRISICMKTGFRIIALLLVLAILSKNSDAQNEPLTGKAQNGVLDLRNIHLATTSVSLNGEWRFYWKELKDSLDASATGGSLVQFPSLWNNTTIQNQPIGSMGYGTYALKVYLPKMKSRIALEIPDVYSSYKMFVNGSVIAQNGEPAANAKAATPFWTTQVVVLPPNLDTMQIVLQVANFWHSKGGTYKGIVIGDKTQLLLKLRRNWALDLVLAGCLFMGGLFFFGLFVFSRKDKAILFFSLFCMLYSYRLAGTDFYVLHAIFPELSWFLSIRLEYLTLVLSVSLFAQYTRYLYPKEASHLFLRGIIWLCFFYATIILITPPSFFTILLNPFLALMFVYIIYSFYVYIQALRHKRSGSLYALISSGVLLVVALVINLQYFSLLPVFKATVFAGYVSFFFLQSLALSHRFSETLRLAAEEARQGLKAKSEFLSTMSHEIRTPLNSVIGMAHLLKRSNPRADQQANMDVLLFSAKNLLSIVNNILDYNKIEAGKISFERIVMDLPAICRNIIAGLQSLADEKRIQLLIDIDPRLTQRLMGDPTRMSQVINNLLHNALKFTREGSVKLSVKQDQQDNMFATITITVEDTGIGIAQDKQQLIFERFTQADSSTSRSYGGTGLGLSISKKILEMQGSALQLKSEIGKGSSFYFTQRYELSNEKNLEPVIANSEPEEIDFILKDVGILLVEDNPMNVLVAQTFLERYGAVIDVANNGEEALEKFNASAHRLVLMDLDMPVMDGYEATKQLRERGETIPVIALTASLPAEVEKDVYSSGFNDIIVKPFDPDDLFRVILHHLKAIAA